MGNDNLSEKPVIMEYLSELIHAQMEDRIPQPLPKGVTLEELQETAKKRTDLLFDIRSTA